MDDVISRQAAIDTIEKHLNGVFDGTHYDEGIAYGYEAAHRHIQDLINALQPAQQWIPVSERLPKANELNYDVVRYYLVQNEYGDMMVASWNGVFWEQMYQYRPIEDKVIAWMPLPEPYREEAEDGHVEKPD